MASWEDLFVGGNTDSLGDAAKQAADWSRQGTSWAKDKLGLGPDGGGGYDAEKYLLQGTQNAQGIYDAAMGNVGAGGPQVRDVVAPTVKVPRDAIQGREFGTGVITAQDVNAPALVTGQAGMDLRNQTLGQIERARTAPSAVQGQFQSGLAQTTSAALAQAGAARGADRAAARRDAILGTATAGANLSGQTAAMAAQEQAAREQAATQGLMGLRSADVAAGTLDLEAQRANQAAKLGAATSTQGFAVTANQANQQNFLQTQQANAQRQLAYDTLLSGQGLEAAKANQAADLNAYNLGTQANLGYLNAATGAQGAATGATGVAANYATGQSQADARNKGALYSLVGTGIAAISDINAKKDVGTFADNYSADLTNAYGIKPAEDPYAGIAKQGDSLYGMPESQTLIQPAFDSNSYTNKAIESGSEVEEPEKPTYQPGLIESIISDERAKADMYRLGQLSMMPSTIQRRDMRSSDVDPFEKGGALSEPPSEWTIRPNLDRTYETGTRRPGPEDVIRPSLDRSEYKSNRAPGEDDVIPPTFEDVSPSRGPFGEDDVIPPSFDVDRSTFRDPKDMADMYRLQRLSMIPSTIKQRDMRSRDDVFSDNRAKADMYRLGQLSMVPSTIQRRDMRSEVPFEAPKEYAKREAESMDANDRIDWAHRVQPITFRYKPGIGDEDNGDARAGVSAQQLESTGPLGELMVHRDPYSGLRKVDGLALGLMMGKAALEQSDRALALAAKKKGGR